MKNLLVLDGNSIINRAFYGVRNLSRSDGLPTNAVYGFATIVKKYIDSISPDFAVCTFDTRKPTFRHLKYDKYKSNRHGMPDELACQLPYTKRLVAALGFTVLECEGFEADDIIGTVCKNADERGDIDSYILTGDRDSLQLISERTHVILMRNGKDELFDTEHFIDVYGIRPECFVDVKALMGDSSDCIPGVPGIGEKTALKLISATESLDKLYSTSSNGYNGATPSLKRKLDEGRESAYMSRDLACICTEAPVGEKIDDYVRIGADNAELYKLFDELEFHQLIRKFSLSESPHDSDRNTQELKCAICETDNEGLKNFSSANTVYVAFDGSDLAVVSDGTVLVCRSANNEALRNVFSHSVICHDLKNLTKLLANHNIQPKCEFDTMLALYLLEPGRSSYPISDIAKKYNLPMPNTLELAAFDISCSADRLRTELRTASMENLMHDIELPLATVLADIELVGFKVNRQGIRDYAAELLKTENELADSIFMLAGHDFNINSPKQLSEVLFDELDLPGGKKTKTGYSTDADTLKRLRFHHPIVSEILAYRKVSKLRGTYGDALADLADDASRIHTSLNQCGTATGRLSSNDPNLQNIPVRDELGRGIRNFFTAENSNYVLIDADYSQIELRLLAHLSGDENMINAFNSGIDIHTVTASQVFGIPIEDVTRELRLRAKAVNFGIVYGIGAFSLAQDIGSTKRQAEEYIEGYFRTYPKVEKYLNDTVSDAVLNGFTVTMFGRRRPIPELASKNKNTAAFGKRVAMNSPIQGSAADIIKLAMINTSRALREEGIDARLILQIHDELIVESHVSCASLAREILTREMENAVSLSIPLTAEAGVGSTWLSAKQ